MTAHSAATEAGGARVRELRLARGLTQSHLARRAGLSDAYISKIERSGAVPRGATLVRLADALGVRPGELAADGAEHAGDRGAGSTEILAAAVELFAARGYSRVSIRELAARAGCSTANLYHHFSSKYDIFVTLIEGAMNDHFSGLREALQRSDDPVEQLRYVLHNHLVVHMTRPEVRLLSDDFHPMTGAERERFIAERDSYEQSVRSIVVRGIGDGLLDVPNPAVAVRAAMGACNYVDRWFRPSGELTPDEVATLIVDFLLAAFNVRQGTERTPPRRRRT